MASTAQPNQQNAQQATQRNAQQATQQNSQQAKQQNAQQPTQEKAQTPSQEIAQTPSQQKAQPAQQKVQPAQQKVQPAQQKAQPAQKNSQQSTQHRAQKSVQQYQVQPVRKRPPDSKYAKHTAIPLKMKGIEYLGALDDYHPLFPDAVAGNFMNRAGLKTTDHRLVRLIGMDAQEFISNIARDALANCKSRTSKRRRRSRSEMPFTFIVDDLMHALEKRKRNIDKPLYYF